MAAESSSSSSSSRSGGGGASADSYLGSLISLTSKCEIRYEGILYNINTDESSIGLRNVRSFGTEGRKKDGPQIPASDKIYEYILFRGSDIKDLQVKSSPPVPSAPLHNDPAIIQSHYSHPASLYASLPSTGSGTAADLTSQTAQLGLQQSTFQGGMPLYQPGGSLGPWGSSPAAPAVNGSGLAMPMYWQGYYAPSSGLPPMQQPPLLRPPPGLAIPHSIQQPLQYPIMNTSLPTGSPNLPDFPSLLPPVSSTMNLSSISSPSTLVPSQGSAAALGTSSLMPNKPSTTTVPAASLGSDMTFVAPLSSSLESVGTMSQSVASLVSSNPRTASGQTLSYQTMNQSIPSIVGSSNLGQVETSVPLVTPDQLLQPGPATLSSSQSSQVSQKDIKIIPAAAKVKPLLPESSVLSSTEKKEPILPLPAPSYKKLNGSTLHNHHSNRDHGRGRGHGHQRPITKFTEDFDFTAMNEKFKKDEVWGHLGRSKIQSKDKEGGAKDDEDDDAQEEDEAKSHKFEIKTVYVKDDFFDSLSCNTLDHGLRNERTKFSEQLKIDTETFGDFPRHRPSRGGGRGFRGGGGRRGRGSYYSRGYGYAGRGHGHSLSNRAA